VIITSSVQPLRIQRFFPRMTRLSLQIRGAFTLTIAREQGEVQAAAGGLPDGIQIVQANCNPSYDFWWKGELWHIASLAASQWSLIIVGEVDANVSPADRGPHTSQEKLDYTPNKRC
jgi:hypothetical protein